VTNGFAIKRGWQLATKVDDVDRKPFGSIL
jgi:hypothetical protein